MKRRVCSYSQILPFPLILLLCVCECHCDPVRNAEAINPDSVDPQPFLPLLAPSPLTPFTNNSIPALSGSCALNFSASENMMSVTATDCWASFAPLLADVVCCPQLDAILATLIGHSSKYTGMLSLDATHAKYCLSDVEKILEGQGANENIRKICSIQPENLTEASCPVMEVDTFESTVDSSRLLAACKKIDPVNECCDQTCGNAILDAARTIAMVGMPNSTGVNVLPEDSTRIDDCKKIVRRWIAGNLEPSSANKVLRGLSNCKVNKVCPLIFPDMKNVVNECANMISNQTACCKAVDTYVSQLQEQSFITNLQALNCAAVLGVKLQEANVSNNVYNLCHINLKDFSLQVGSQEYGCLLPSLPSDATFDKTSGISFICDLNDNIAAPWPSSTSEPPSSCKKHTKIPAVPKATSAHSSLNSENLMLHIASLMALKMLLSSP